MKIYQLYLYHADDPAKNKVLLYEDISRQKVAAVRKLFWAESQHILEPSLACQIKTREATRADLKTYGLPATS